MIPSSTQARDAILASIREHLAASAPEDARAHEEPPASPPSRARSLPLFVDPLSPPPPPSATLFSPQERFLERARAVGVQCHEVATDADALIAVRTILASAGARHVGLSDAAVLAPLREMPGAMSVGELSHDALFACDAGVTAAQLGVAETGSLGLLSAREHNRVLSLVPPLHVALLRSADIHDTLEAALMAVRGVGEMTSHAITFITGPSRTSDIELTLAIGVHGPQSLHVVVIASSSPDLLLSS